MSEDELDQMFDKAESRANYLNVFWDPMRVRRETQLQPISE